MEISKQFFEEILKEKFLHNNVTGIYCKVDGEIHCVKYNDFFFDCKKWALDNGYQISSKAVKGGGNANVSKITEYYTRQRLRENSEVEAVIRATQWLYNKLKG